MPRSARGSTICPPTAEPLVHADDDRHPRDEHLGALLVHVVRVVAGGRVVGGQGGDGEAERRPSAPSASRRACTAILRLFWQAPVARQACGSARRARWLGGELAVPEEVRGLFQADLAGDLLDIVATDRQDALESVDLAERGPSSDDAFEATGRGIGRRLPIDCRSGGHVPLPPHDRSRHRDAALGARSPRHAWPHTPSCLAWWPVCRCAFRVALNRFFEPFRRASKDIARSQLAGLRVNARKVPDQRLSKRPVICSFCRSAGLPSDSGSRRRFLRRSVGSVCANALPGQDG